MFARWSAYWKERYESVEHEAFSLADRVKNSYLVSTITGYGQWLVDHRNVRNFAQGLLDPFWYLPEALVVIRDSSKVRKVFQQTLNSSGKILGVSFVYYNIVRPQLETYSQDGTVATADNVVYFYLLAQVPRLIVEDAINSVSLADTFSEVMPKKPAHFECDCDVLEKRRGNFNTNIHYVTHSILLFGVSHIEYVGRLIAMALTPWFIGQSNMDYRLNMCDPHRYRHISLNNFYLTGKGATVLLGSRALCYVMGVDREFSALAVTALVMKLGMLTTVMRVEPMPGQERARDLSYYVRYAAVHFVQNRANDLNVYLRKKRREQLELARQEKNGKELVATNSQKNEALISDQMFKHIYVNLSQMVSLFIGSDYAHLKSLVRTGPMRLLIELKKDQIKDALDSIQGAHRYPVLVSAVVKVSKWLPQNFLPSGVTSEDLSFFKRVVFLNGVKKALPLVADLVGHALRDPKILEVSECIGQVDLGMDNARNVALDDYLDLDQKITIVDEDKFQQKKEEEKSLPAVDSKQTPVPSPETAPAESPSNHRALSLFKPPPPLDTELKDALQVMPLSNSLVDVNEDYYAQLSSSTPAPQKKTPLQKQSHFKPALSSLQRMVADAPRLVTHMRKELGLGKK